MRSRRAYDEEHPPLWEGEMTIEVVCATCGSDDVSIEAFVRWSVEEQKFEVVEVCDKHHYCVDCDGECRIEEREVTS